MEQGSVFCFTGFERPRLDGERLNFRDLALVSANNNTPIELRDSSDYDNGVL